MDDSDAEDSPQPRSSYKPSPNPEYNTALGHERQHEAHGDRPQCRVPKERLNIERGGLIMGTPAANRAREASGIAAGPRPGTTRGPGRRSRRRRIRIHRATERDDEPLRVGRPVQGPDVGHIRRRRREPGTRCRRPAGRRRCLLRPRRGAGERSMTHQVTSLGRRSPRRRRPATVSTSRSPFSTSIRATGERKLVSPCPTAIRSQRHAERSRHRAHLLAQLHRRAQERGNVAQRAQLEPRAEHDGVASPASGATRSVVHGKVAIGGSSPVVGCDLVSDKIP